MMSERYLALPLLSCLASTLVAAPAVADVPPPYTSTCVNRNAGDACDLIAFPLPPADGGNPRGVCGWSTCSRPDYTHWDRDASASPPSMQYMCLMCMASADGGSGDGPSADGPVSDGPAGTAGDADLAVDAGTHAPDAGGVDSGASTGAKSSGGCAIAGLPPRTFGPWLLAGAFGAIVLIARRRR
jgi:hypothetical protein